MQEILVEFLKGIGKAFLNPLLYYLFFVTGLMGVARVKRERKNFNIRAENAYYEMKQLIPLGIVIGFILSIMTLAAGIVIPIELIMVTVALSMLWSLTTKIRFMSPVYTVGLGFFAVMYMMNQGWKVPLIPSSSLEWNMNIFPGIIVLLAILLIGEGLLIVNNASIGTSPKLINSRRGLRVGVHEVSRLWMLPLFLIIPGEAISAPFSWWPVFTAGNYTYSIILVPFAIGFYQQVQGMLPKQSIQQTGKKVFLLGIAIFLLSIAGYFYPIASMIVGVLAILGREWITFRQWISEKKGPFFFSKQNNGVMILGTIPDSRAAKMGLAVGEIITKVNGVSINNEKSFYEALQKNAAHCKLQVLDVKNEIRLVQGALYEGDHFKLGILFVEDVNQWDDQAM